MTDETLEKLIGWFNRRLREHLVAVPVQRNVWVGVAWSEPLNKPYSVRGDRVFFVTTPEGECVGVVLDMRCDLHTFTLESYRRRGFMAAALENVILPFLAADGRKEQCLTYRSYDEAAARLVSRLARRYPPTGEVRTDAKVEVRLRLSEEREEPEDGNGVSDPLASCRLSAVPQEALEQAERHLAHAANLVRAAHDELALYVEPDHDALRQLENLAEDSIFNALETVGLWED